MDGSDRVFEDIAMKIYDLKKIQDWFKSYANSFCVGGELPNLSEMKRKHSYRVESVGRRLVNDLEWDGDAANLGIAASLLHDVGRFSQFRDFGTLYDAASVDHGDRGHEELSRVFPRKLADEEGFEAILEAVRWHNKKSLPTSPPIEKNFLPFCKLVRDADKIDVFKLVQEHIDEGRVGELLPRHAIGAPLTEAVLLEIEENGRSSYKNVKSLADFLLLQITWLLDVNFAPTFRMIDEGRTVEKIISRLPLTPRSQQVLDGLLEKIKIYSDGVISDGIGE